MARMMPWSAGMFLMLSWPSQSCFIPTWISGHRMIFEARRQAGE